MAGLNFQLGSYIDKNGQLRPYYSLKKTECLYIATKFNDEAEKQKVTYNLLHRLPSGRTGGGLRMSKGGASLDTPPYSIQIMD